MIGITDRQRVILQFCSDFIQEWGYPPTLRRIAAAMNDRHHNGARVHLEALERKGFIQRGIHEDEKGSTARALRITESGRRQITIDKKPVDYQMDKADYFLLTDATRGSVQWKPILL